MNTSGLIFAVVVGLWAAYLVPMWLRRQDELNEARPTERFTTAIRLLSGRGALERRTARETERRRRRAARAGEADGAEGVDSAVTDLGEVPDLRGYADPVTEVRPAESTAPEPDGGAERPMPSAQDSAADPSPAHSAAHAAAAGAEGAPPPSTVRATVLARRRRTTMVLFLAFVLSGIASMAIGRASLLWIPAIPGGLLSMYIWHLRRQERRRYAITMDRRRAEEAARHLRARPRVEAPPVAPPAPVPETSPATEGRRALVEETDHAEWVDQQRGRTAPPEEDGWEPAPVPLPTYVSAPVAPRHNRGVDLDAPDTWSAARSTTARSSTGGGAQAQRPQRTPLFDQYADEDRRPRAAGE